MLVALDSIVPAAGAQRLRRPARPRRQHVGAADLLRPRADHRTRRGPARSGRGHRGGRSGPWVHRAGVRRRAVACRQSVSGSGFAFARGSGPDERACGGRRRRRPRPGAASTRPGCPRPSSTSIPPPTWPCSPCRASTPVRLALVPDLARVGRRRGRRGVPRVGAVPRRAGPHPHRRHGARRRHLRRCRRRTRGVRAAGHRPPGQQRRSAAAARRPRARAWCSAPTTQAESTGYALTADELRDAVASGLAATASGVDRRCRVRD